MVLGTSLLEFNPEKVPLLAAILSCGRHDGKNFAEKAIFPKIQAYPTLRETPKRKWVLVKGVWRGTNSSVVDRFSCQGNYLDESELIIQAIITWYP
jgi:hypothetical protein